MAYQNHSLIAIMLGRLEMTIDQCIDAFTSMMGNIFNQKKDVAADVARAASQILVSL